MGPDILDRTLLGNTLLQWLVAVSAVLLTHVVLGVGKRLARRRLEALAPSAGSKWVNIVARTISRTKTVFLLLVSLFLGSLLLQLPERTQSIIQNLFVVVLLIQAGIWLGVVTVAVLEQYRQRTLETDPAAATTITAIGFMSRIVIWSIVVLMALDNLGFDVTAVVAGLGIGGVAVALAVQNILGDLFASLSIILDKPFVIGDFLIINEYLGSVEYIGLKTTRIRSLSGEQLIFSNSDLLGSRIRNYGRMFERRVVFSIGVTYQTARDKLKRIPGIIREAVDSQDQTRFDRSHFTKYGDYALMFESVYYVLSPDYNLYMDIQQAINFAIHERFEHEAIEFAYPTQTVFVAQATE